MPYLFFFNHFLHYPAFTEFLLELLEKRKDIIKTAREARLCEGISNIDDAFEKWYKVSNLIDVFETQYFDPTKIQWAKKQGLFHFSLTFVIGLVTGIITSIVANIIIEKLL